MAKIHTGNSKRNFEIGFRNGTKILIYDNQEKTGRLTGAKDLVEANRKIQILGIRRKSWAGKLTPLDSY